MMRRVLSFLVAALPVLACTAVPAGASEPSSTRGPGSPAQTLTTYVGCCSDPDVRHYSNWLDFTPYLSGTEIGPQFRSMGVVFGHYATPRATRTYVRTDVSRASGCQRVLNGDPVFPGWEFFIFVSPTQPRWSLVQKVSIDLGYCDLTNTSFIAAYDQNGQMLEWKFNDRTGFQCLWIERPSA